VFLYPLGLLALLAVPLVAAIHLFRRRFRPREVSALFLWHDEDDLAISGRRRERLRTTPSFWLELLAALLLALAFAGPRLGGAAEAEHLVVVLDASASMGTEPAELGGTSLAQLARERVADRIDELSSHGRVTIIESGPRPTILAGPAAFRAEARSALEEYAPAAPRHDLSPAVALAAQLSGRGAVLVITDHWSPGSYPEGVELVSIGRPTENVAITHATRTRVSDGGGVAERVLLTLTAFTAFPGSSRRVELVMREFDRFRYSETTGDGRELARRAVTLEPEKRMHLGFDLVGGTGAVEILLESDALEIDNRVVLAPPPRRTVAVATTLELPAARALGLALPGSPSPLDRLLAAIPDVIEVADPGDAHLVIGPELEPKLGPGRAPWSLLLVGAGSDGGGKREDLIGPFLAEKQNRLLQGLTLEGIVWSIDPALRLPGTPLVSAGDTPILTESIEEGRRVVRINIDPARSSLPRSPDWPILLSNLVERRREELPGPRRSNISIGESYVHRFHPRDEGEAQDEEETRYLVRALDGEWEREIPARDTLRVEGIVRPGLYSVSRGDSELARFGVGFSDPAESDLRGMRPGDSSSELALATLSSGMNPLQVILILAVFALLLVDWEVLARARGRLRFDPDEHDRHDKPDKHDREER
jgi:Ca-activated chloride channel homolog